MKVYLNPTGQWTTAFVSDYPHVEVDVHDDRTLQEVAEQAVALSGTSFDPNWIWPVSRPDDKGRQQMGYMPAVVDGDGILRWLPEGITDVTIRELRRTHEVGIFDGDVDAIAVEHMLGGNGVFPGWEDLLEWIVSAAASGAIGYGIKQFGKVIKRRFRQWKKGGARPFAFLDVVLARETLGGPRTRAIVADGGRRCR